jgi:hypothetical protein
MLGVFTSLSAKLGCAYFFAIDFIGIIDLSDPLHTRLTTLFPKFYFRPAASLFAEFSRKIAIDQIRIILGINNF